MTPSVVLSVVVPAHNEAPNLARLVAETHAALDPTDLAWELVVADDGSTDETPALLAALAATDPRLRSLRLERRGGQTAALAAGFRAAAGRYIATLDADLQCPPAALPVLLEALDGADLACGIRARRSDPFSRRLASALANLARRLFLAPGLRDLACPLRVIRADALGRLLTVMPLFDGAHRWLPVLFALAGLRVVQRPVPHLPRTAGVSKYTTRGRIVPIARELAEVLAQAVRRSRRWRIVAALALGALVALPFVYALGAWPLLEPDEPRNAEVAREMLELGSWSVPHFNHLPYLDKPVLLFWMIAAAFRVVGVGELGARLPAAAGAVATVALTFALGRLLLGVRRAALAAAIVASAPLVLVFGRLAIFDMPLTALVSAALYCLVRARTHGNAGRWLPLAGLAMGLATLTKGPVGLAVPLLAWMAGRGALPPRPAGRAPVVAAVIVTAAVVLPWLGTVVRQEPAFLRYALLDETLLRVSSVSRFHRGGPVYYYVEVLLWGLGAWAAVLAAVLPALVRRWRAPGAERAAIGFLARAAGAILIFFTLCASKRPAYILPAIVPLALLAAAGIAAERERAAAALRAFAGAAALAGVAAVAVGLAGVVPAYRELRALAPAVLVQGGLFLVLWGCAAVVGSRGRPAVALACAALLAPGFGFALLGPLSSWAEARSSRTLAARIEPAARVVCFGTFRTGLPFYLRRPVVLASDRGGEFTSNYVVAQRSRFLDGAQLVPERALPQALGDHIPAYAVASARSAERLAKLTPRRLVPVYDDGRTILLRVES